ncbi:hypothetical protein BRC93_05090 [Halobacteriales archaeon QS_5_70_15]|nr:MAG: hypothetical protein BRC93_05090 [Halobacteriales archaeon QS_5_70_15]
MGCASPDVRTALVLAATLVLAGCSGVANPGGTPTRSATPAPVPTDATPPARAAVPGVSPLGVENASLLAAAHRRRLAGTPFTERTVTTARDRNGTVLGRRTLVVERGPDANRLSYAIEGGPRRDARSFWTVEATVWSDGRTTVHSITDGDGSVRRERVSSDIYAEFVDPEASLYARTLERASIRRVDRRIVDGTTRYVFVAQGIDPRPAFGLPGANPTGNASLRAVVAADGTVHRVEVTFPALYRGRAATVEHVFEYDRIGTTTVTRPPWYDEAIQNGTPTPGVRAEG